jgi:hypothetical protein
MAAWSRRASASDRIRVGRAAIGEPSAFQPMPAPPATRRRSVLCCVFVALTALACGGLLLAAALVPAPAVVLPLVAAVCIGLPMAAAYELPAAIDGLRRRAVTPLDAASLDALREQLDALPETHHPLGL